jgi:glycosyltransferase involved in cell wall biosynthesis
MSRSTRSGDAGRLRILHAGSDVCGIPGLLAEHQRRLGHDARALRFSRHAYGFDGDIDVRYDASWSKARRLAVRLRALARYGPKFDVFHLHAYDNILPRMLGTPLLHSVGKTVVVHFHGCEVKQTALATAPDQVHCGDCALRPECAVEPQLQRRRMAERWADAIIVSTPDLLVAVPTARYVPNPVDLERWREMPRSPRNGVVRFVHVPSSPLLKGTAHVEAAVAELRRSGYRVELAMATDVPHRDMPALWADADVMIDQLNVGWYGVSAVEAMAMGRPAAAFLYPQLAAQFGEPPLIRISKQDIAEVLARTVDDPSWREAMAEQGREYARSVHDARRVAAQVVDVYREAMHG